jgi:hypothetical protein
MNEPQSIDTLLTQLLIDYKPKLSHIDKSNIEAMDKAKAAIEAMVRDILGNYDGNDLVLRSNLRQQRLRAFKYNLKLEKE